jgi:hypothetical protein
MSGDPPTYGSPPPGPALVEVPSGAAHLERVGRAANAARALCDVLWEVLQEQLGVLSERRVAVDGASAPTPDAAQLAEGLADVTATLALLAGTYGGAAVPSIATPADATQSAARAVPTSADAQSAAVLIDERDEQGHTPPQGPPAAASRLIGSALKRFERDGLPFAVLLVELLHLEHLRLGARTGEQPYIARLIESAFTQALETIGGGPAASLAPEPPDRYWLLVPEANRLGAHAVAGSLVSAFGPVAAAAGRADPTGQYFAALSTQGSPVRAGQNGAPQQLAVGTAACPENGRDAATLARHADLELTAARAAAQPIISMGEPV